MKILYLNLCARHWLEIKSGKKHFEYRERTGYWTKRIVGKEYDLISFAYGYPKKTDREKFIVVPYQGYTEQTIKHEHFGDKEVKVFAIPTGVVK